MTLAVIYPITYILLQAGWPLSSKGHHLPYQSSYLLLQQHNLLPQFQHNFDRTPLSMELLSSTMAIPKTPSDMDVDPDRISTKANNKTFDIQPQLPEALTSLAVTPYNSLHGSGQEALAPDLRTLTYTVAKSFSNNPTCPTTKSRHATRVGLPMTNGSMLSWQSAAKLMTLLSILTNPTAFMPKSRCAASPIPPQHLIPSYLKLNGIYS